MQQNYPGICAQKDEVESILSAIYQDQTFSVKEKMGKLEMKPRRLKSKASPWKDTNYPVKPSSEKSEAKNMLIYFK